MEMVWLLAPVPVLPPVLNSGSLGALKLGSWLVAKKGIVWSSAGGFGQMGLPPPSVWLRYVVVGSHWVSAVDVPHRRKKTLTLAAVVVPAMPFRRTRATAKL